MQYSAFPPPYTEHGQGYVYTSVSYQEFEKRGSSGSGISAWLEDATNYMYMDHQNAIEDEQRHQHTRARSQNRLSEPFFNTTTRQPSSLPQRQWQEVPIPYRPREWHDRSEEQLPPRTSTPPQHVPPFRQFQRQLAQPIVQPLRPRKRPEALTSTPSLRQFESHASDINPALLYPQLSPYDGESTPEEPQQHSTMRSVSQPNTPSFHAYRGHHADEPDDEVSLMSGIPNFLPPARQHTTTTEAPFTDDEEFHLFVQATAGLGPEQPLRGSPVYQENRGRHTYQNRQSQEEALPLVSPIHQQTPTTVRALQHMAQLPQPVFTLPRRPTAQRLVTEPIHASDGGLDLWVEPPSADMNNEGGDVSPMEADEDELPGYAESQAQAQAVQATEARRRAQELARRWQQAHQ